MSVQPIPRLRSGAAAIDPAGLLDSLPLAIVTVDRQGVVTFANPAALSLLNLRRVALLGQPLGAALGDDNALTALVTRLLDRNVTVAEADCQLGASVGVCAVTATVTPDGASIALTLSPRGRRRSEGSPSKAPPVARTLAHEVRNPLAGIRGAAQLIGKHANTETRALTDLIVAEVDRIRRLTDRLDAYDSETPLALASLNIHSVLDRVIQLVRSQHHAVDVQTDYDPSLPMMIGDGDQLIQALLNLAKNAVEAAPSHGGGRVVLASRYRTGMRLRGAANDRARPLLEISVRDNGPGVAPHILDRLFDPFTTTKPNGAGLGLAVCSRIVAAHGGHIDVESKPGATAFRVYLPLEATP